MIFKLFKFFTDKQIEFCITNGYVEIVEKIDVESDIDILLRKQDFKHIEQYIKEFCLYNNINIVQILHHDLYAKNIFLYHSDTNVFLNLDIYGKLCRRGIILFKEDEVFNTLRFYDTLPILSTEKEFIYYLTKKLDKNDLNEKVFQYIRNLYLEESNQCNKYLDKYILNKSVNVKEAFINNNINLINRKSYLKNFDKNHNLPIYFKIFNIFRTIKRIFYPTGLTISFLGPDGSGKSTIIDEILEKRLPFRRKDYFHLKPFKSKNKNHTTVEEPHKYPTYSKLKSYIKLLYFIYQYNLGWLKNIMPLKIKSSLVIFDRYFDDMLVDTKRYRYGGSVSVAKFARLFIPKLDIYFILTSDPKVIYKRKQEVPFEELERQIKEYKVLVDGKRYFAIDVNRTPDAIAQEIIDIMMEKMNERY